MTSEQFQIEVEEAFLRSKQLLNKKEKEYSGGKDRLDQFKKVAIMNSVSPTEALWGMSSKHVTSLATMVRDPTSHTLDQWVEKLTDLHNYLFLLGALLIDVEVK